MRQTSSPTLLEDPNRLIDQTTSSWTKGLVPTLPEDTTHQKLSYVAAHLAARTNDGGTRLASVLPQLYSHVSRRYERVSTFVNLLITPLFTDTIVKTTHHSSRQQTTPINTRPLHSDKDSPHLDAIRWIRTTTGLSQERIGRLIGVTRQTINNWENGAPIADINRRRLLAVREVLERAALRHVTPALLATWLDTPRGAEGRTPAELLEMGEINRARLLAMSSPSSRLVRAQSWAKRPIPEAFRTGSEHYQEALPPEQDDEFDMFVSNRDDDAEDVPIS